MKLERLIQKLEGSKGTSELHLAYTITERVQILFFLNLDDVAIHFFQYL